MEQITEKIIEAKGRTIPVRRVKLICEDDSLTKQSFTKAQDIRTIIANSLKTGQLPASQNPPLFGDFTNASDFLTKLNQVAHVKSQFESLPAKTRERFANNPANLLDFMADEKNNDEAVKLGLRKKPESTEPIVPSHDPNKGVLTPPTV